ncbi:deoxyguanosinetriphosphate triphosphohydrolase [Candidatus Amarolinea aalborgensis]|uniref:deoxyguanosinetriphosphate triphosphohydrolase n=1 Tax=Candidatus Amarolinea aalborgensis TaxID=2249329 RepID=UPI003BF9E4E7
MIQTRSDYEQVERERLAPYAMKSGDSRGRRVAEEEPAHRSVYQRDRDRIIHTTAFRRLEYKTQVFVNTEGDHYRTRLTHSIEVAQVGRSLARALRANEDLTEAICLAHDLGHPPFGHTGEQTLNSLMQDFGGFDHQRQTMRILDQLEKRYVEFDGLNLTYEVREGLVKHDTDYDVTDAAGYNPELAGTLECQLANLADEIAYNTSDLDDGLRAGLLRIEDVRQQPLWQQALHSLGEPPERPLDDLLRHRVIRRLVGIFVRDAIEATAAALEVNDVRSVDELRALGRNAAGYTPDFAAANRELKRFLLANFYRHYRVIRMASKAQRVLTNLFTAYLQEPLQMPAITQAKIDDEPEGLHRVICDYIAGMTDRYALEDHAKLFDPAVRV